MLELVKELADFEQAPNEVTVTLSHFEESGFGERPVWWAYVACIQNAEAEQLVASESAGFTNTEIQDPLLAQIMEPSSQPDIEKETSPEVMNLLTSESEQFIQLSSEVIPIVPEALSSALPVSVSSTCEQIIGLGLYYIRYSTWKGQRMFLEDLIVTESWRHKGVGTALMDALIGEAKASRLHGITWQVLNWNEPAIKFYERYGARFDAEWVNVAIDV